MYKQHVHVHIHVHVRVRVCTSIALVLACTVQLCSGEATFKSAKDNRCLGTYMSLDVRSNVDNARKCAMFCSAAPACQSFTYYIAINTCIMHRALTTANYIHFGYKDQDKLTCQFFYTICPTSPDWTWFAMKESNSRYYYINSSVAEAKSYDQSNEFCLKNRQHFVKFDSPQEMSIVASNTLRLMDTLRDKRAYVGARLLEQANASSLLNVVWAADGSSSTFPALSKSSAAGSCLVMSRKAKNFTSAPCNAKSAGFVCECEELDDIPKTRYKRQSN